MSYSRSPRAVRSMTIGTRGMPPSKHLGTLGCPADEADAPAREGPAALAGAALRELRRRVDRPPPARRARRTQDRDRRPRARPRRDLAGRRAERLRDAGARAAHRLARRDPALRDDQ